MFPLLVSAYLVVMGFTKPIKSIVRKESRVFLTYRKPRFHMQHSCQIYSSSKLASTAGKTSIAIREQTRERQGEKQKGLGW